MNAPADDMELLKLGAAFERELKTLRRLEDAPGSYDARNAACTRACRLMRAIHRHPAPTTMPGIAVKLRAVVFDLGDFHTKFVGLDVAERQIVKLQRQVSKLGRHACAS